MSGRCEAELCPHWTGQGCACGLDKIAAPGFRLREALDLVVDHAHATSAQRDQVAPEGGDLAEAIENLMAVSARIASGVTTIDVSMAARNELALIAVQTHRCQPAPSAAAAPAGEGPAVDRDALVRAFRENDVVSWSTGRWANEELRWAGATDDEAERMADVALAALRDAGVHGHPYDVAGHLPGDQP